MGTSILRPIERDDAGAAEPQIVLERNARALHLPLLRRAPQLLRELVALRKSGCAEWMPLRQQAARRIGHDPAAVRVFAVLDEPLRLAFGAQAQRFIGDELVVREAIVE